MRWINLEPIVQSEVNQKEKHKYCVLRNIYGIQKHSNGDPICRPYMQDSKRNIDVKNRLLDYVGEGMGGMI